MTLNNLIISIILGAIATVLPPNIAVGFAVQVIVFNQYVIMDKLKRE